MNDFKTPKYKLGDTVYYKFDKIHEVTIKAINCPHKEDKSGCAYAFSTDMFASMLPEGLLFKTLEELT